MDRFQNGDGDRHLNQPIAAIEVSEFGIEARQVGEEIVYTLHLVDEKRGYVDVFLGSQGMAQLLITLAKAGVGSCDAAFLTMLMVMMTETPEESVERLFESGHAKDNSKAELNYDDNLARGLRRARLAAGIGFNEAARLSGLEESSIWRIEEGHVNPRVSTMKLLTKLYGANVNIGPDGLMLTWLETSKEAE